jgi:hypothetical protein
MADSKILSIKGGYLWLMKMTTSVLTTGVFVRFRENLTTAATTAATLTIRTSWKSAAYAAMRAAERHS